MDPATEEFHDKLISAVRTAEVMSIFFVRVGQSLILDMRRHGIEGPLVLLDEMVATPRHRLLSFNRLRPELPLPDRLTLAPWPGAVASFAECGVLDVLVARCQREGGSPLVDQIHEVMQELTTIERAQLRALVRGVGMQTLWQRHERGER